MICSCQSKHLSTVNNCASIRNGQFVYFTYDDGSRRLGHDKLSTFITRTDTLVTYTIQPMGIVHTYKIDWIGSCEYKLRPFGPISWVDSLSQQFAPYTHKILKVEKKYILEYSSTMIDTFWIDK